MNQLQNQDIQETKQTRSKLYRNKRIHNSNNILKKQQENEKLDEYESDFYEEPNLYTENLSDEEFNETQQQDKILKRDNRYNKQKALSRTKKIQKIQSKKAKNNLYIKQNFNLKKIVIQQQIENQQPMQPPLSNFESVKAPADPLFCIKFCCICNQQGKYSCPKCTERFCRMKCYMIHKDIKCLKFEF